VTDATADPPTVRGSDETERYRTVAHMLYQAARPLRVLASIRWPPSVREEFLAGGADRLPEVEYGSFDTKPCLDAVYAARRLIFPGSTIDDWFDEQAKAFEATALMLSSIGTPAFHAYSRNLYGAPDVPLRYDPVTPLDLARRVHRVIDELARVELGATPPASRTAEDVAAELTAAVDRQFGADAPKVEVVPQLSANALATSRRIRVRQGALFTDRDAAQLLQHEAFIHVATSLNGRAQADLPILGVGHPGTTRTQEGIAVFSEFVSGTLELDRFRRLADRVLAVQMAIDGADFVEVFRWFAESSGSPEQAFENTRRVFRGGVITGGSPFTKDVVYVSGFLQVSTFVRAAFAAGRADCLRMAFAGKLDIWAIPALCELHRLGLCRLARYLPPWASDPRSVLTWLTYSTFAASIDLTSVTGAVSRLLDRAPVVLPDEAVRSLTE
jgi:uncharacterized protein (TIGR02421 family)